MNKQDWLDVLTAAFLAITICVLASLYLVNANNLLRMQEAAVYKGYGTFDISGNFTWK